MTKLPPPPVRPRRENKLKEKAFLKNASRGLIGILAVGVCYVLAKAVVSSVPSGPSHKSANAVENLAPDEYLVRAAEMTQKKLPLKSGDGSAITKAWAVTGADGGAKGLHYIKSFEDSDFSQLTAEEREDARKYNQNFLASNLCKNSNAAELLNRGYAYTYHIVDGNGHEAYAISISSEQCDALKS